MKRRKKLGNKAQNMAGIKSRECYTKKVFYTCLKLLEPRLSIDIMMTYLQDISELIRLKNLLFKNTISHLFCQTLRQILMAAMYV